MKTWYVYELRDQRTDEPFYIGMTGNISSTMARHWNDKDSAAAQRCRELREADYQLDFRVLSSFDDRRAALDEEARLIATVPGLTNRTNKPKKPKLSRFLFLLSESDREALERVRVKLGARSFAEALRRLIALSDDGPKPDWPAYLAANPDVAAHVAKAKAADTSSAKVTNPGRRKVPYGSLLKKK